MGNNFSGCTNRAEIDDDYKQNLIEKYKCVNCDYSYLLKLILCGPTESGKSLFRYTLDDKEMYKYEPTIGVDFCSSIFTINDEKYKIQTWDLGGSERFQAVTQAYYRGSSLVLFIYKNEYNLIQFNAAYKNASTYCGDNQNKIIFIFNKPDEAIQQIKNFEKNGFEYEHFMMDVKNKQNIQKLFEIIIPNCNHIHAISEYMSNKKTQC